MRILQLISYAMAGQTSSREIEKLSSGLVSSSRKSVKSVELVFGKVAVAVFTSILSYNKNSFILFAASVTPCVPSPLVPRLARCGRRVQSLVEAVGSAEYTSTLPARGAATTSRTSTLSMPGNPPGLSVATSRYWFEQSSRK